MLKIDEDALDHYKNNKHEYYFENQEYGDKTLILTNGDYALVDLDTSLWSYIVFRLFSDPVLVYKLSGPDAYKKKWFHYKMTRTFRKALKEKELKK